MKSYSSQFWKIVVLLTSLLMPLIIMSLLMKGEGQDYFQLSTIIVIALLLISLGQQQTTSISINSSHKIVLLEIYRPFFRMYRQTIPIDSLTIKYGNEHIARGNYAKVIRITDVFNAKEYKLSGQMLWWEESVIDQIVIDFKQLGKLQ